MIIDASNAWTTRSFSPHAQLGLQQEDCLAKECLVHIAYNGVYDQTLEASPQEIDELVVGYSLSEGIVKGPEEICSIDQKGAEREKEVNVTLHTNPISAPRRLEDFKRKALGETMKFDPVLITNAYKVLREHQVIGRRTGCTHIAAWVNQEGLIEVSAEDISRHVALDKLLGKRAMMGERLNRGVLMLSSRASHQLVKKVINAGVEILFVQAAVTSLAVDLANRHGLTLVGFCREGRASVFTHPQRLYDQRDQEALLGTKASLVNRGLCV